MQRHGWMLDEETSRIGPQQVRSIRGVRQDGRGHGSRAVQHASAIGVQLISRPGMYQAVARSFSASQPLHASRTVRGTSRSPPS